MDSYTNAKASSSHSTSQIAGSLNPQPMEANPVLATQRVRSSLLIASNEWQETFMCLHPFLQLATSDLLEADA